MSAAAVGILREGDVMAELNLADWQWDALPDEARQAAADLVAERDRLLAAVEEARSWNNSDLRGIDDITPDRPMLLARRQVLARALRAAP